MRTRVCVKVIPDTLSRGIHRVAAALVEYAPDWVQIVDDPQSADIWVIHTIGHGSLPEEVKQNKVGYALIQYCLLTTEDARPEAWMPDRDHAQLTWSYYDIAKYCRERLVAPPSKLYHAPLGVDGRVFKPETPLRKRYIIGTSGYIADTEGVREAYAAARQLGREMFHLGPNLNLGPGVSYMKGLGDDAVAEFWSQCSFVAGLRRIEGFELPALEALACGSRPIMFDAPHYKTWFGEHAEYVPETSAEDVTLALRELFARPARVVTPAERSHVVQRFDWPVCAKGFWEALR